MYLQVLPAETRAARWRSLSAQQAGAGQHCGLGPRCCPDARLSLPLILQLLLFLLLLILFLSFLLLLLLVLRLPLLLLLLLCLLLRVFPVRATASCS